MSIVTGAMAPLARWPHGLLRADAPPRRASRSLSCGGGDDKGNQDVDPERRGRQRVGAGTAKSGTWKDEQDRGSARPHELLHTTEGGLRPLRTVIHEAG